MQSQENIYNLFKLLKDSCDWLSFRHLNENSTWHTSRDGRTEALDRVENQGLMMEVVVEGSLAYGGTSDLSPEGLKACFEQTRQLAEQLGKVQLNRFDPSSRGRFQSRTDSSSGGPKELGPWIEFHNQLSAKLKGGPNVLSASLAVGWQDTSSLYLTSDGGQIEQTYQKLFRDQRLTGSLDSTLQTRSDHGYFAQSCRQESEALGADNFDQDMATAERLISEVNELLRAPDCPEGPRDLLLAPDQMMLQIHESIGHPLELDRILGDERNYAGWSFVKPEDFGRLQYGSPLLNVVFDPNLEGELASYEFDDSGTKAEKVYLIRNGLLVAGLGGSESQLRSGLKGVANFRAQSWNRAPIDRMANINLEPGTSSLEEMIASVEKGVFMHTNLSWSIDDYRNKFQFGCEYARLIEDGRLTSVVKNPNYRSNTIAFWNSLKAVGNASTFEVYGTPHCGKGEPNQVIQVGHASPVCLFKDIDVFGGS